MIKKVEKQKISIKNPKISKFYKKFKTIIFENIKRKNFALAVSGGSDSLCLAYFSKIYASEFKNKIHVLIVNHKLRKESQNEALKVNRILKKIGIQSKILNWTGNVPKSNIFCSHNPEGRSRNIQKGLDRRLSTQLHRSQSV